MIGQHASYDRQDRKQRQQCSLSFHRSPLPRAGGFVFNGVKVFGQLDARAYGVSSRRRESVPAIPLPPSADSSPIPACAGIRLCSKRIIKPLTILTQSDRTRRLRMFATGHDSPHCCSYSHLPSASPMPVCVLLRPAGASQSPS
jgi:hypothetical protein